MKLILAAILSVVVFSMAEAQFMGDFMQQMNMMMGNIMSTNQQMFANNQRMFAEGMRQARTAGANARNVPPGTRSFDDGNTRGFTYRSPDGSFSGFSFASGPGSSGYMFQAGPDGVFERRW